ncbi:MAG: helix-turn-helix transcriptional regulator [Phormidesmis sp. CAN_BIN36]|nr:helix-turn-helix transcriptional regulator [Phormidesmis sp. CAN_BIN36]
MIEPQNIAELVREFRLRLGLTQEEFAAKLGVTFPTVNRWENRRAKPSRMAIKLIEALLRQTGESTQDLLTKYFTN